MKHLIAYLLITCFIVSGCSKPQQVEDKSIKVQENVFTFENGETVELWRSEFDTYDIYKISDGQVILSIYDLTGPDNSFVGGLESLSDLNENAQQVIKAYYDKQGLLYDVNAELVKSYEEYLKQQMENGRFNDLMIRQDISPASSNDTIICFLTTLVLPDHDLGGMNVQEYRLGAVFNKETGTVYDIWDLFYSSREVAIAQLFQAAGFKDEKLITEMTEAIEPEYIILLPDYLQISFPRGSLASQEYQYLMDIDYDDLKDVIREWAIPDPSNY